MIGLGVFFWPSSRAMQPIAFVVQAAPLARLTFTLCHTGGGTNCIVDGDAL